MSKYICKQCGSHGYHTDFKYDDHSPDVIAVFCFCKGCGNQAWGGVDFSPSMNEVFNQKFSPNFNGPFDESFGQVKTIKF